MGSEVYGRWTIIDRFYDGILENFTMYICSSYTSWEYRPRTGRLSINTQYSSRPIDHSECSLTLRPHHPFLTQILGVNDGVNILCISMRSLTGKIRAVSDVNYPANTQYCLTHPRHRSLIKMRIVVAQIISGRTHETLKLSAWVI